MRVERTSAISNALPLPAYEPIGQRSHSGTSSQDEPEASTSRTLSDIAQQFNLRKMCPDEAVQLAERLMQEDLLTPSAYSCLTGVPMTRIPGKGFQPRRDSAGDHGPYDYISEFEGYVSFVARVPNNSGANLLQSVLNILCSLDARRKNGPLDLSA